MVFIFAEFALLGKGFFNVTQRAFVRVAFRVYRGEVGKQPIGRDFFADGFPREFFNVGEVTTAQGFADVFRQGNASLDECFVEVRFGDVHDFIFCDFAFGCKDYSATRAFIFSRTFLIA